MRHLQPPVLNLLKPGEPLFITEGSSDCWAMLSAGHKAIAIPSATLLTRQDIEMLSSLPSQPGGDEGVPLFPDRDPPVSAPSFNFKKFFPPLHHHHFSPPNKKNFANYPPHPPPHPQALITRLVTTHY